MSFKKEEAIAIWYTLSRPRKGGLLRQLEDGGMVAKIRQRGIEGAVDCLKEDTLDCLLEQLRSYQGGTE
jgi:hypothetical protein